MNRRMMLLLLLVATLSIIIGFDRFWLSAIKAPTVLPQFPTATEGVTISQGALNPAAGISPDIFAPIFDRPLFRPSRFQSQLENDVPGLEPNAVDIVPDLLPPLLLGTVSLPKPGGAFLADGSSGETAFVAVGQSFGPWRLLTVGDGLVELEGPKGQLRLAFPELTHPKAELVTP